jgi:hypothetical protein
MLRKLMVLLCVAGVMGACTSSSGSSPSPPAGSRPPASASSSVVPTSYRPHIDPADFSTTIDNPYFPLIPGTVWVYTGIKDGQRQRDVVKVTNRTRVIMGVTCVAVSDIATHAGQLLEKTEDWYTQDKAGNVWYFGENTAEYENGKIKTTEGSWQSGVKGAEPGIIMQAHPAVPDSYRQEYFKGQAEDMAWVVDLASPAKAPYGTFRKTLLTLEWSRLEPGVVDKKFYAPGVGVVLEVTASGPRERAELVSLTKP